MANNASRKFFLIVSAGQSDLQVWVPGNVHRPPWRERFPKEGLGDIHSRLRDDPLSHERVCIAPPKGWTPHDECRNDPAAAGCRLYPAKLAGLVHCLHDKQKSGDVKVVGGLFFGTNRDSKQFKKEPRGSHIVLAKWFAKQFDLNAAEFHAGPGASVWWHDFLVADEKLEGDGDRRDFPVSRIAAARIDTALARVAEAACFSDAVIGLSHTGAFCEVKGYLLANAEFRFPGRLIDCSLTEHVAGGTGDPAAVDCKSLVGQRALDPGSRFPYRVQSMNLRQVVEQQLWQGDFAGAWSACAHLAEDRYYPEEGWILGVKMAATFLDGGTVEDTSTKLDGCCVPVLQGALTRLYRYIEYLTGGCGADGIMKQALPTVVRSAFRVEAALQATRKEELRILDAIRGTSNFRDVVLRAFVYREVAGMDCVDTSKLDFADNKVPIKQSTMCSIISNSGTTLMEADTGRLQFAGKGILHAWIDYLENDNGSHPIGNYHMRLNFETKTLKSPAYYRNQSTHRELGATDLELALKSAAYGKKRKPPLWNPEIRNGDLLIESRAPDTDKLGKAFLAQPIVSDILKAMEIEDIHQCYREFFGLLIANIRAGQ